ncbi:PAS domain-containing protein [Xanthobacter sediminis]
MMTETKARALDLTEPRLAPLRHDNLPSFLVDAATSAVIGATAACTRLGVAVGRPLPPRVAEAARALADGRARPALVRLRLPRSLTPRLFRGLVLDISGAPAVLFADPSALADDPALQVETRLLETHAPSAHGTPQVSLESVEPSVRFTFETDGEGRVRGLSPALATALGDAAEAWIGASFPELEEAGRILSAEAVAEALAGGASFSGVHVTVPGAVVLELELGGVPLFDTARRRVATRGFGVMRRWVASPAASLSAFDIAPDADVRMPLAGARPARPAGGGPSNVLPFGSLSPRESTYFREIGRTLEAAIRAEADAAPPPSGGPAPHRPEDAGMPGAEILDTLPLATLLEDDHRLVHANRAFFRWTGWPDLDAVRAAGGVPGVLHGDGTGAAHLLTAGGERLPVTDEDVAAPFQAPGARLHILRPQEAERTPIPAQEAAAQDASDPRRTALDLVPWPVLIINADHLIRFANRAAEARLGLLAAELEGQPITLVIAPEARGEAAGWLDAARLSADAPRPRVLYIHPLDGPDFRALAGLAPVAPAPGADAGQMCLVLGPEPRMEGQPADARSVIVPAAEAFAPAADAPGNDASTAAQAQAASGTPGTTNTRARPATAVPAADLTPALHLVARRLAESLGPSFSTLADHAPEAGENLPAAVRDALERIRRSLDDLGALAAPLAEAAPEPTVVAPIVKAAVAFATPAARRRHVTMRTDIDAVPLVSTRPARLARLIRLMIEDALDGAPAETAVVVSLMCDDATGGAPVVLQVADAGPAVDEVDDTAARDPLAPSTGTDRFSRAGRPLRRARLAAEAAALGATFELRRGVARGMSAQLSLPR